MKRIRTCIIGAVTAAAAVTVVALAMTVAPSEAKAASSFQIPCFPYGTPNYAFGQYIGGWGYHVAEDVCHNDGIPVYAAADGIVRYSARTPNSYRWGNLIVIQHSWSGRTVLSLYGHLNNNRRVGAGARVKKGQRIGTVGPRGASNGYWSPHTHFGIRQTTYKASTGSYDPTIHGYEPRCCAAWLPSGKYVNDRRSNYDYVGAAISGSRWMYNNGQSVLTFKLWNTGRRGWLRGGDTPVRIGATNPAGRTSIFSDGGAAAGWSSPGRIELMADTAPNRLGQFRATFKSNGNTGTRSECFAPLVETVGWMRYLGLCATMTIRPPDWRGQRYATYVTDPDSGPTDLDSTASASDLLPGDRRSVKILVKNIGELDWKIAGTNRVRLVTARTNGRTSAFRTIGAEDIDASENWIAGSRPSEIDGRYDPGTDSVVADEDGLITTGEIAVFSFVTTTPDKVGNIREYFTPVVEGKKYMADTGSSVLFNILDRGYHYSFVSKSATPSSWSPGVTSQDVTLRLKNTGRESWPIGGALELRTDRAKNHLSAFATLSGPDPWLSRSRPSLIDSNVTDPGNTTTVLPGQTGRFDFTITVPSNLAAGKYKLYVRPVVPGVAWLPEDYGINFPVTALPQRDSQVMKTVYGGSQTNFARNSVMNVKVAVKNMGRLTWPVSGAPVRLATTHPRDRTSAFRTLSGVDDPWLSKNRVSNIDGRVDDLSGSLGPEDVTEGVTEIAPGEIALFNLYLTARPAPGYYREFFSLVQDGGGWFPDDGYNMLLKVR
ncbi:MAG: peptidoglycan DD-metalloendopeptidase family protein [bacterium]|nr:peptidoglycan DD-metalloendopeptidase family protein [bacterium]